MSHRAESGREFFAHTLEGVTDTHQWEPLAEHLELVARLAERFAAVFDAAEWGRLAGVWHDLGKYSNAFQDYLLSANGIEAHVEQASRVDHSTAGAQHAVRQTPVWGRLLAYAIAGHHAGLADASVSPSSLDARLRKRIEPIVRAAGFARQWF